MERLAIFADVLRTAEWELEFTILDVGAREIHAEPEPFYQLLDLFPGSRVLAFEPDETLCAKANAANRPGVTHYPVALGRTEERRDFYQTREPMCSSLYRPNQPFNDRYNHMDVADVVSIEAIDTISLDRFCADHEVGPVDFIKIDIQGAELDAFQGGTETLGNVLGIVSECEFVANYVDQPLFGDVCAHLAGQGLQFQKILGVGGRTLKPILLNNDADFCSQQMWADVLFLRDLFSAPQLWNEQRLKMAVLALIYDCIDVSFFCCGYVDESEGENIGSELKRRFV